MGLNKQDLRGAPCPSAGSDADRGTGPTRGRRAVPPIPAAVLLAGVLPCLAALGAEYLWGDRPHPHEPLHESLELAGAFIALGVALLLLLRLEHEDRSPHLLWIVLALVVMGLADGLHAVAPLGAGWSWLRHISSLAAGLLSAGVWIAPPLFVVRRKRRLILCVVALSVAGALVAKGDTGYLPAPWTGDTYSFPVRAMNALGGLGFLVAAAFFFRRYSHRPGPEEMALACYALLFGAAGFAFGFSHVWGADWWAWHGFRLLAYASVLQVAYRTIAGLYRDNADYTRKLEAAMGSAQAERQHLNSVLDQLPAYLVLLSPDYRTPFANRFFRERFGEPLGRRCYEYLFNRFEPCLDCETFRALEEDRSYRWEWSGPDGRIYDVHDFPFTGVDGTRLVMEVGLDITERKQAEAALRRHRRDLEALVEERTAQLAAANARLQAEIAEHRQAVEATRLSETRFRTLAAATFEGIAITQDGRFVDVNEQLLAMLGYAREELMSLAVVDVLLPEDRERVLCNIRAGRASDVEHGMIRRDGGLIQVEAHGQTIIEDGRAMRLTAIRDITEHKRAEATLRELDRRKDEFLATLAHELRNPLAPILSGLEIIRRTGGEDPAALKTREMIERQVRHMVRLIDDLLDINRIRRGQVELVREPANLADIARLAIETSHPIVQGCGHTLDFEAPAEALYVEADPVRLAQALANLLNNAAKYTGPGGHIAMRIRREGDEAVVSVRDNGIGIPPDMLERVFDMFAQVDPSLAKTGGGLGIGLNLVKNLVEMHGGRVKAHSEGRGRGSEFTIHLPTLDAPAGLKEAPARDDGGRPPPRRRVLVADDNQDAALSLAALLELMGHEIRVVHDGLAAVALAESFRPGLILLDIGMPGLNGYEVCRKIREWPWARGAVIVALTGWGQDDDKRRAKAAGFDGHFTKPVDIDALEAFLADVRETRALA